MAVDAVAVTTDRRQVAPYVTQLNKGKERNEKEMVGTKGRKSKENQREEKRRNEKLGKK